MRSRGGGGGLMLSVLLRRESESIHTTSPSLSLHLPLSPSLYPCTKERSCEVIIRRCHLQARKRAFRRNPFAGTLIMNFQPSEPRKNNCVSYQNIKPLSLWYFVITLAWANSYQRSRLILQPQPSLQMTVAPAWPQTQGPKPEPAG